MLVKSDHKAGYHHVYAAAILEILRIYLALTLTLIYVLVVGQFGLATGSGGITQSRRGEDYVY
jgi:hypothetical protein